MKFIHISDLHLGKRVNEYSMLDEQEYILKKILRVLDEEKADGVLIAGDVYDKTVPSAEAVALFDDFLYRLSTRNVQVFIISGNHDSPERLAFASRLIDGSGVHISPVYQGEVQPIVLQDNFGALNVYMLPFIKPTHVRRFYPDEEIESYTDAMRVAIAKMQVNPDERNLLITHQFVTGSARCESEEISVGGTDNVDVSVFDGFDYVALGHLHGAQNCAGERVRYCGTPLKYSFSEVHHEKSVTVVELNEKGRLTVRTTALIPRREMREIKGKYEELTLRSFYENTTYQDDYLHVTLTDEEDVPDAIGKLRAVYRNIMKLDYDNARTRKNMEIFGAQDVENKTPFELFSEFYALQNNQPMSEEQTQFMRELIEKTMEESV